MPFSATKSGLEDDAHPGLRSRCPDLPASRTERSVIIPGNRTKVLNGLTLFCLSG